MERIRIPLLAVDAGGTKTSAVLADETGTWWGSGRAGSCNYQGVGIAAAKNALLTAVAGALAETARLRGYAEAAGVRWEIGCAVLAVAGLDTERDRQVITGWIQEVFAALDLRVSRWVVENDAVSVLLGATDGKPGVLVIAGTGAIAIGINGEGTIARASGWGHRVGDEGSGYWIGKQAIAAVLRAHDGRGEATRLTELITQHLGLSDAEDLFSWSYSSQYAVERVGELARLVSQASRQGDPAATAILRQAGTELADAAGAVIKRLELAQSPFALILQGGVLQHDQLVRQTVTDRIQRLAPHAALDQAQKEPISGVIAHGLACLRKRGAADSSN